ncbi:MAG: hypothetical protein DMG40_28100 [Acidobacteria bacterium]|nr:MAG: hypothetical protein DMG40_28100 [Acidobacteriota bacterium]
MPPKELRIVEADSNRLPETYQIGVISVVAECGIANALWNGPTESRRAWVAQASRLFCSASRGAADQSGDPN